MGKADDLNRKTQADVDTGRGVGLASGSEPPDDFEKINSDFRTDTCASASGAEATEEGGQVEPVIVDDENPWSWSVWNKVINHMTYGELKKLEKTVKSAQEALRNADDYVSMRRSNKIKKRFAQHSK